MKALFDFLNAHGTKIIGYITLAAGFIATADPALIEELLGAKWQRWALLIVGLLTAVRGHQNTAREKAASATPQSGFARVSLLVAIALGSLLAFTGCASSGTPSSRGELAKTILVQGATVAYIKQAPLQDRAARAKRVADAVTAVLEVAKDGEITLQRLVQIATERIPATADPADRLLAMNIIRLVQDELQANIGVGGLESDTLVRLSDVLGLVLTVTSLYISPSS